MSYTQYLISPDRRINADVSPVATDFTGDGVPDLRTVAPAGVVTAYVVSERSATGAARLTASAPQALA
ncbi:hypothetical protein QEZ54_25325 [Catellatospora sp. KI3]|uniref:hypothetical protein n=1 Tax=Catellatospora sp. KI3 TaxID=3041620 RepID=UPI00248291B9|nr:hypothetical protein [Catellatospora sp. KI3]MDI1464297.1 hypothetical protein [Catellatospora sp. KI3]